MSLPSHLLKRDNWLLLEGSVKKKNNRICSDGPEGKECQGEVAQFVKKKMPETLKMIERRRGLCCDWLLDCCVLIRKKKKGGGWGGCKELQSVDLSSLANDDDELWN